MSVPQTTLPASMLAPYLRVRLEVAGGVLRWEVPRALLGVLPAGTHRVALPVADVASAGVRAGPRPLRLLAGLALLGVPPALGIAWGGAWWGAIPLAAAGAWVALVSLSPRLEVVTRSGARFRAAVCVRQRFDAALYAAAVNDLARQEERPGG